MERKEPKDYGTGLRAVALEVADELGATKHLERAVTIIDRGLKAMAAWWRVHGPIRIRREGEEFINGLNLQWWRGPRVIVRVAAWRFYLGVRRHVRTWHFECRMFTWREDGHIVLPRWWAFIFGGYTLLTKKDWVKFWALEEAGRQAIRQAWMDHRTSYGFMVYLPIWHKQRRAK